MNNNPLNRQAADRLLDKMMTICETYGWDKSPHPDAMLWEQLSAKDSRLEPEDIKQMKELSQEAGGWWHWPNGYHSASNFVTFSQWVEMQR